MDVFLSLSLASRNLALSPSHEDQSGNRSQDWDKCTPLYSAEVDVDEKQQTSTFGEVPRNRTKKEMLSYFMATHIYSSVYSCGSRQSLNTKLHLSNLKTQFVPRRKHFLPRL